MLSLAQPYRPRPGSASGSMREEWRVKGRVTNQHHIQRLMRPLALSRKPAADGRSASPDGRPRRDYPAIRKPTERMHFACNNFRIDVDKRAASAPRSQMPRFDDISLSFFPTDDFCSQIEIKAVTPGIEVASPFAMVVSLFLLSSKVFSFSSFVRREAVPEHERTFLRRLSLKKVKLRNTDTVYVFENLSRSSFRPSRGEHSCWNEARVHAYEVVILAGNSPWALSNVRL